LSAIIKARLVEHVSNVIGDEVVSTVVIVYEENFKIVNKHVEIVELLRSLWQIMTC